MNCSVQQHSNPVIHMNLTDPAMLGIHGWQLSQPVSNFSQLNNSQTLKALLNLLLYLALLVLDQRYLFLILTATWVSLSISLSENYDEQR